MDKQKSRLNCFNLLKPKTILFALLTCISCQTLALNTAWRDHDGNTIPDKEWMKSIDGFGGWLVITPDKDWQEKWNTPTEHVPHFNTADKVTYGESVTILIFFTNPKPDQHKLMNISCDIETIRPDNTIAFSAQDVDCANWEVPPPPYNYNVQLTRAVIQFTGEPEDPSGEWVVNVVIKDNNAGIQIPLNTSFTLEQPLNTLSNHEED